MTASPRVRYETDPRAITITLADPDAGNPIDRPLLDELGDAFVRAGLDREHSVVVLRSTGAYFSCGDAHDGALGDISTNGSGDAATVARYRDAQSVFQLYAAVEDCPKTTIAVVQGDAHGTAVDLLLMCDLILAVRGTTLVFDSGRWGLADTPCATRLMGRVGTARAKDVLFSARELDADGAERIGLVNRLCDQRDLDAAVDRFVAEVLTTSPNARRLVKEVIQRQLPPPAIKEHAQAAIGDEYRAGLAAEARGEPAPWSSAAVLRHAMVPSSSQVSDTPRPPPRARNEARSKEGEGGARNGATPAGATSWRYAFERLARRG